MVACVGWPADPPCPVYGDLHGCKLPDGHTGRHVCKCHTLSVAKSGDVPAPKGARWVPRGIRHAGGDS